MNTATWAALLFVIYGGLVILGCIFAPKKPTPGSDRERDCPGVPGARAGCPDRDCRGRA